MEDLSAEPGSGRSPGEENGKPFQYSCLENSTERGDWLATVYGVAKSWTQLNDEHFHFHKVCVCIDVKDYLYQKRIIETIV